MNGQDLTELIAVAEARKQQAEARLARICREEAQLRGLLQDMSAQFRQGMTRSVETVAGMHATGAHQAWVDFSRRRRAAINRDLARITAEKLDCSDALRRELGRRDALAALEKEARVKARRRAAARDQEKVLAAYLLGGSAV